MNDIAARIGGEEFALLIRDADMPQVLAIAERLRQAIEPTLLCTARKWIIQ